MLCHAHQVTESSVFGKKAPTWGERKNKYRKRSARLSKGCETETSTLRCVPHDVEPSTSAKAQSTHYLK